MIEIIPTLVPASIDEVHAAAERYAFAGSIHIDAGDGAFVPNATWQPAEGDMLPASVKWEAHLMLESPEEAGIRYAKAGASRVIAHLEAFSEASRIPQAFSAWKAAGASEAGLAIRIDTPLEHLAPVAALADSILVMTIASIGQQGSPFDPRAIERVNALRARFPGIRIGVDGGVNESNIAGLMEAGASRFCVGAALASSAQPEAVYTRLHELVRLI